MNSTKHACSLNNQGVDLLVSGESARAMKVFQSALSLLKKADQEAETTSCTEMNILCDDASVPFYESTSTVSGLQDLHCYVYDHGIMISENVNGNTNETLSLYIAVVVFNSALASHSDGMALGREKSLTKASVLYNLVAQLLTRCTMPEVATFTTILTLLALNNKAQIYYDRCEYAQAVDCMKEIVNIIGSVRGLHSVLNGTDFDGLLLNVMILSTPTAAQAA
jgi:tetratricopeptide (TPR) repeat protein